MFESIMPMVQNEFTMHPVATLSGAAALLAAILGFTEKGRRIFTLAVQFVTRKRGEGVPNRTLAIVENPHDQSWSIGGSTADPAMWVRVGLFATNISEEKIKVLACKLLPTETPGIVMTCDESNNIYGLYPIAPNETAHLSMSFCLKPPIVSEGQNFSGRVVISDGYGNEHKSRKMAFTFSGKAAAK